MTGRGYERSPLRLLLAQEVQHGIETRRRTYANNLGNRGRSPTVQCSDTGARNENNKLTYFTFSKPVQLPGKTLPAGKYRFELADPQESRRVIKVSSEDGSKQLAMLQTVQYTMRDPAKEAIALFGESPASEPVAVQTFVYPGETIGFEFHLSARRSAQTGQTVPQQGAVEGRRQIGADR